MRSVQLFIEDRPDASGGSGTRTVTGLLIGSVESFSEASFGTLSEGVLTALEGSPTRQGELIVSASSFSASRAKVAVNLDCETAVVEAGAAFSVTVEDDPGLMPHFVSVADGPHGEEAILALRMTRPLTANDPIIQVAESHYLG